MQRLHVYLSRSGVASRRKSEKLIKAGRITVNGVKVISSTIDIANARLEFDNGCVANLTSSRVSQKVMRNAKTFYHNSTIGASGTCITFVKLYIGNTLDIKVKRFFYQIKNCS